MLSKEDYQKWLNGELDKPETDAARNKREAREKAESHRNSYIRLTPEQLVQVCVDLEAMALEWRKTACAGRVEIGRLRKIVRTVSGATGIAAPKDN